MCLPVFASLSFCTHKTAEAGTDRSLGVQIVVQMSPDCLVEGRLVCLIHAAQGTQSISLPGRSISATGINSPYWLTGSPLNAPSFVATGTMGDATVSVYTCELRVLGHVGVSLRK